ncbi:MAG: group II intron reverse transcriptase/maturase [Actinomycetota bacterium]|nr:group II intron reverse transcriptase/maturase [Actinomycetota bacterium]
MPERANDVPRGNAVKGKALPRDPVRALQWKLYRAAKQSRSRRFHALYDKVCRRDVLNRAWLEVARNGGAPGVDGVTIVTIEETGVAKFLEQLQAELVEKRYRPLPVRRVSIPKRTGGQRHLGVPAVRDRVVQAAAKMVLEPLYEADFTDVSFGFRPKRNAHQARERIRTGLRQGRRWVVDADIKGFFDNLDHDRLVGMLRQRISDRRVLDLIRAWLGAGVLTGDGLLHPEVGTPQGGVISPLLANVFLHHLDQVWQQQYRRLGELTRYADDLVICCGIPDRAEATLATLRDLLTELGLELAEAKTRIVNLNTPEEGFDFLGYHFRIVPTKRDPRCRFAACWPSRAAVAAARDRIRELTPPSRIGRPTILVVDDVNRFLKGWGAYFRHGNSTQQFHQLDAFVFERVARFIARKHGSRNWRRGVVDLAKSRTRIGLYRLAGTIGYPAAHAPR